MLIHRQSNRSMVMIECSALKTAFQQSLTKLAKHNTPLYVAILEKGLDQVVWWVILHSSYTVWVPSMQACWLQCQVVFFFFFYLVCSPEKVGLLEFFDYRVRRFNLLSKICEVSWTLHTSGVGPCLRWSRRMIHHGLDLQPPEPSALTLWCGWLP